MADTEGAKSSAKYIIGIGSGKGGVGKSTLSVLLAEAAASKGLKVGLLDADITGPSAPRLMGLEKGHAGTDGVNLLPIVSEEGIKLMSINLLVDSEESPVIWRGPLLSRAVEQFWTDCAWGNLDLLVVDLPPGTGDVLITALTSIPMTGVAFVATPQDLVSMIVAKAVGMARSADAEVLGVVENMGSYICPDCGHEHPLFAAGASTEESAKKLGLALLGSFPFRPEIAQSGVLRWNKLPAKLQEEALKFEDRVIEAAEIAAVKNPKKAAAAAAGLEVQPESKCEGCEHKGHCEDEGTGNCPEDSN